MAESLRDYLDFATETAYLAGRLTLGYFQAGVRPEFKEDESPITIADRQSEELIRGRIEKRYPGHAIVGEEYGSKETEGADHRWFVDPIDGTKSFVRGVPLYGVLRGAGGTAAERASPPCQPCRNLWSPSPMSRTSPGTAGPRNGNA